MASSSGLGVPVPVDFGSATAVHDDVKERAGVNAGVNPFEEHVRELLEVS